MKAKVPTAREKVPILEKWLKKSNSSMIEVVRGDRESSEEDLDYNPKCRRADSDFDLDDLPDTIVDNHGKDVTAKSK